MEQYFGIGLVILGAALSSALAGIGSAVGCGLVGEAASGVTTEDPNKFGVLLLLQAIPGTQGIYGFVGMFLILAKIVGVPLTSITISQGFGVLCSALPVGLVGLVSAIFQGRVCVGGVSMVGKRPEEVGKAMVFAVVVETYAVLGLLTTILLLGNVRLG